MNLNAITGSVQITRSNQSEQPQTNLHESIPEDTATYTSDDTHVYYNNGQTVTPPDDGYVSYNDQSGLRGTQTSPDTALDELYSKPNKPSKPLNDSEDYEYVCTAGGNRGAGGSGGAEVGGTNVENQNLDYIDIDHNVTPVQRSEGVSTRSLILKFNLRSVTMTCRWLKMSCITKYLIYNH
ncbi:hypothetical protein NP493_748g01020 [Ridgeia piscesae]|uniref:Uncharacterized protein n=1 Tax=Ridgeia piscesae TaxID=27915 RepID=A0AAD9KPJ7_RIDPI|nr:hypothetical protein NP493_748g01020 [Ridgeia piscesae]